MRNKRKILAITVLLMGSSSFCAISLCPHNDEVTSKIEELANDGKATFHEEAYHLIGRSDTSIFYTEKLLENDAQLNGFLKVSRVLDKNLPEVKARWIELLPTPNFCAYQISLGENSQVIALSLAP